MRYNAKFLKSWRTYAFASTGYAFQKGDTMHKLAKYRIIFFLALGFVEGAVISRFFADMNSGTLIAAVLLINIPAIALMSYRLNR